MKTITNFYSISLNFFGHKLLFSYNLKNYCDEKYFMNKKSHLKKIILTTSALCRKIMKTLRITKKNLIFD